MFNPCFSFLFLLFAPAWAGSGQQSVTGVENADDGNSYWQIRGKPNQPCQRGVAIKCGQSIRITHMKTGRNLHSHHFTSPLSNNQVSTVVASSLTLCVLFMNYGGLRIQTVSTFFSVGLHKDTSNFWVLSTFPTTYTHIPIYTPYMYTVQIMLF